MWEEPEDVDFAYEPPEPDSPEAGTFNLVDLHPSEEEDNEFTEDSLRFPPVAISAKEGTQDLLEGYRASGLSAFTPEIQKYIELLRRDALNKEGVDKLNPELTDEERTFVTDMEGNLDAEVRSFYSRIVELEFRKVPVHWSVPILQHRQITVPHASS